MKSLVALASLALLAVPTACTSADHSARSSTLVVHIGLFGGPPRPNGGMALSNAPQAGASVAVTDGSGHRWHSWTGADGNATFALPPGRYVVHSSFCGRGPRTVRVHTQRVANVAIHCDVP